MTKKMNNKRYKMSMPSFIFMSIIGMGFALKNIVSQFTEFGNFTSILYLLTIIFYAVPFLFIIFEFVSLKRVKNSESGYQSWMSTIFSLKYGFIAGFFYFFVNIFWFLDLVPNLVYYGIYTFMGNNATGFIETTNGLVYGKILVSLVSIILFWIGTYVSTKGPKWLEKVAQVAGGSGIIMTALFIIASLIFLIQGKGSANIVATSMVLFDGDGKIINDITWDKLGSIAWGLQAMGGLEAMASYKNDFKGGEKGFRKAMSINVMLFASLFMIVSILMQFVIPADEAATRGLLSSIYYIFQIVGFPSWWTNIIALVLTTTTLGSLLLWTSAPVKVLFADAPKGIFGKKMSQINSQGTPVHGLIAQAVIVSILFIFQMLGTLSVGANTFLTVIKNLNAGAATIPVIFMAIGFVKLRLQSDNPKFERSFYAFSKNKIIAILAVTPLIIVFVMATLTGLVPSPASFESNLKSSLMTILLGPLGIFLAFIFCQIVYKVWEKKNPLLANDKKTTVKKQLNKNNEIKK